MGRRRESERQTEQSEMKERNKGERKSERGRREKQIVREGGERDALMCLLIAPERITHTLCRLRACEWIENVHSCIDSKCDSHTNPWDVRVSGYVCTHFQ